MKGGDSGRAQGLRGGMSALRRKRTSFLIGWSYTDQMDGLQSGLEQNPQRRWQLPDRIFFGHGACHICAGIYLEATPLAGFITERWSRRVTVMPETTYS